MPLLVPITIFSSIILFWLFAITHLVVGLFGFFTDLLYPFMAASMIGGLAFIVGIIGANARPNRVFQTLYAIGAIWLGAVTIAGFFGILLLIFAEFTGFSFQSGVWAILFGIIVLLLNIWGIYSSWVPRITSYRVTIDKEHSWHGRRIAMI
jgi:hypothetical protein